jgi:RNA polymerase sigma factor (sigma-70 family)
MVAATRSQRSCSSVPARVPIGRDEEAQLLLTVVQGRAAAGELARNPGPDRRAELLALVAAADRARARVVETHQGFVAVIARRCRSGRVPLEDLIQEGNIGLLDAIDRFDPEVGVRFATYAFYAVRRTIVAALPRHHDGLALSRPVVREANRVRKLRAELEFTLSRTATAEEVAQAAHLSPRRVRQLEWLAVSLLPLNDETALEVADTVDDGDPANQESDDGPVVRNLLEKLPPPQRTVIASRYGFESEPRIQRDIAEELGVSESRVSQIERAALERLRFLAGRIIAA